MGIQDRLQGLLYLQEFQELQLEDHLFVPLLGVHHPLVQETEGTMVITKEAKDQEDKQSQCLSVALRIKELSNQHLHT